MHLTNNMSQCSTVKQCDHKNYQDMPIITYNNTTKQQTIIAC